MPGHLGTPAGAARARPPPPPARGREPPGAAGAARRQGGDAALLERLPGAGRPRPGALRGLRRRDALGRRGGRLAPGLGLDEPCTPSSSARLAEFKGKPSALLFGSGYLANTGVVSALARPGRGRALRRAQPRQHHRRLPALAGRDLRLSPPRHRAPGVGPAQGGRARGPDRHRRRLLDGRRRRAAGRDRRARGPPRLPADGGRGPRHGLHRARGPRLGRGGRAQRRGGRGDGHARQGARQLRGLRLRQPRADRVPGQRLPALHLLHGPAPVGRRSAPSGRWS